MISQQYTVFNFLKSNTVLNVLFTIIAVNKDLKCMFTSEGEEVLPGTIFLEKVHSISQ